MALSAGIAAAATIGGAYMASSAASDAADTQSAAAQSAAASQAQQAELDRALQERMYSEGVARQEPWYQAGQAALQRLQSGLQTGGEFAQKFGNVIDDPSYQFRLQQGQRALEASAAAKGQLFTAGQQQALQGYGQDVASTEYQNAYNRFYSDQTRRLNEVAALAGTGQTVGANLASQGSALGTNLSSLGQSSIARQNELLTSGAAAQAAGSISGANAWNDALSTGTGIYNTYQRQQALQNLGGGQYSTPVQPQTYVPSDYVNATEFLG